MASLFKWLFGGKRARDAAQKSVGEAGPTVRQTMSGSVGEAGPTVKQTDREAMAWALIRLGEGCRLRGDLDAASRHFKKASEVFRELQDKVGLSASLGNQANILCARGDLDGAMALHKEGERIWRELGNPEGLAASLANQANLLSTELNQHRQALPLAEEAFRLATNHGLATLANWSKSVLDKVRSKAK